MSNGYILSKNNLFQTFLPLFLSPCYVCMYAWMYDYSETKDKFLPLFIIFIPNMRAELMPRFEKMPKPKNKLNTHKVLLLVRPKTLRVAFCIQLPKCYFS